jgi:uncharacterized protein (TIGR02588 family)
MKMMRLSFQDWVLAILAAVTIAFIGHVWASQSPSPSLVVTTALARNLRETDQYAVQFVLHNRGDAAAGRVRVRIAAGDFRTPERLQVVEDFVLANPMDADGDMIRIFTTPRPVQPVVAAEEPKPAVAPAAGRGPAPAAAPGPGAPAPVTAPAVTVPREIASFVLVVQAEYPTGGLFGGVERKRWYYFYREGDGAAVQLGEPLKLRMAPAVDALLR